MKQTQLKNQVRITTFLLVIFAAFMVLDVVPTWNSFVVSPDSSDYVKPWEFASIRPPIYPWFTALVNGFTPYVEPSTYPQNQLITINSGSNYFVNIAQAQKLLLIAAYMFLAGVVARSGAPLLGPLFFIIYWQREYQTSYGSYILSECVTESLILILIAVFLLCVQTPRKKYLYFLAIISASIFLTRPAAAYVGAIFAAGICFLTFTCFKKYWLPSLFSIGLASAIALWVPVYSYIQTGYFSVSGMSNVQALGFAIQFAEKSDRDLMPTASSREFLDVAVDVRNKAELSTIDTSNRDEVPVYEFLTRNIYVIGLPIAKKIGGTNSRQLIKQFNSIILKKYRAKHIKVAWTSFVASLQNIRPKGGKLYLSFVMAVVCFAVFGRNKNAYIAFVMVGTQLTGLLLMNIWGMPSSRYINALNIFGLLPICFIFLSFKRMVATRFSAWETWSWRR